MKTFSNTGGAKHNLFSKNGSEISGTSAAGMMVGHETFDIGILPGERERDRR